MHGDNSKRKYSRIQKQFQERSNKRYDGKRVRTDDVIEELAKEWCLSVSRVQRILKMKL